jgi:hypothetical protein
MVDYRPVTDAEWEYLTRRFVALERLPGMRALFDRSLPGSPYDAQERRDYRTEVFTAVRSMINPDTAFPNPYFELTWYRIVQQNPSLAQGNITAMRTLLWNAYFRPQEPPDFRQQQINEWKNAAGDIEDLPIVTDRELEVSE